MKNQGITRRSTGATTGKLLAIVSFVGIAAGILGGVAVVKGPEWLERASHSIEGTPVREVAEATADPAVAPEKVGFSMGKVPSDAPVESIVVTLEVGPTGEALEEPVDLHLGVGFPLRLHPLGGDSRGAAFAAIPQKSSLARGENSIPAGGRATFEFSAGGEPGQDTLGATPLLFRDLRVSDLRRIGFASRGLSEWTLQGYRIEVNGALFAANDAVGIAPRALIREQRDELVALVPRHEVLLREIAELEAYVATGLATPADATALETKKVEAKEGAVPINRLAGLGAGYYPWFVEQDTGFMPAPLVGDPVGSVEVTLFAGGGEQPGTRNPLYFKAGGKKYLLTSEIDPFTDGTAPQEFLLSEADFEGAPLTRAELDTIGIGVVGSETPFGVVPDRAKIQRVVVKADGKEIYDSERKTDDRRSLGVFWLVPPGHFDESGNVRANGESEDEKFLWTPGLVAPSSFIAEEPAPKEPEPLEVVGTIDTTGLDLATTPEPVTTPDTNPIVTTPANPGSPDGSGGPTGMLRTETPDPGLGFDSTGTTPFPGGSSFPGNTSGGYLPGTFAPSSFPDPSSGLNPGLFLPTALSGNNLGGLLPPVRRLPVTTGAITPIASLPPGQGRGAGAAPRFTPGQVAQLTTALTRALRAVSPNSNPAAPPASPPTPVISNVRLDPKTTFVDLLSQPVVEFTVSGNTSGVDRYRVELLPVLPHRANPVVGNAVAQGILQGFSQGTDAVGTTKSVPMLTPVTLPPPDGWLSGVEVKKDEWAGLWVQPRVTGLDATGKAVPGVGATGSLFPMGSPAPLFRGITTAPTDDPGSALFGSYQIFYPNNQAGKAPESWRKLGILKPATGEANRAASLFIEEGSISGLKYATPELVMPAITNTAARTRGPDGETATLVFEGFLPYLAPGPGLPRGYRLVGHVGFLGGPGDQAAASQIANFGFVIELSGPVNGGMAPLAKDLKGAYTDPDLAKHPFFVLGNIAPIGLRKAPGGPEFPLDAAIRFDLLDQGLAGVAQYPMPAPAAAFAAPPGNPPAPVPWNASFGSLTQTEIDAYEAAKAAGGFTVTVTIFMDTTQAGAEDTLALFGLRLVPDFHY